MELKAQDLRVGNKIYYLPLYGNKDNYLVNTVDFHDIQELEENNTWFNHHYKPIPINEDILLKCGFRKDKDISYRWYFDFGWAVIIAYDLDDNCVRIGDSWDFSKLIYVHELQNLIFALTKTELTINL